MLIFLLFSYGLYTHNLYLLKAAKDLYNTNHYAWTCFTYQQSAEKKYILI
ncbi:MAG: HEPN domain-containing protein [Candidatus Helarchaeota archaeon]